MRTRHTPYTTQPVNLRAARSRVAHRTDWLTTVALLSGVLLGYVAFTF